MGFSFSNIHLRNSGCAGQITSDAVAAQIAAACGWKQADRMENSEIELAIFQSEAAQWVTIAAEVFMMGVNVQRLAETLSAHFHTDALAVGCFDSDVLFMNLMNADKQVDLLAIAGHPEMMGLEDAPENDFEAWKDYVPDTEEFGRIIEGDGVFAESCMTDMDEMIGLPYEQGVACADCMDDLPGTRFYYYTA